MESQKREGRRRLIAVFPIQRVVERGVSQERIGGGMGGGMRSKEEGEGAGNQPGTRRGEEGAYIALSRLRAMLRFSLRKYWPKESLIFIENMFLDLWKSRGLFLRGIF